MKLKYGNRAMAIAVAATVASGVIGGATIAEAASSGLPGSSIANLAAKVLPGKAPHGIGAGISEKDVLAASGLTQAQLKAGREAGKSIAQIIKDNGGDPAAVEAKIMAALKVKLEAAVTAGKITSAQEATALTKAQSQVDAFMNRVPKPVQKLPAKIASAGLDDAAKVLGIQPADLRAAMKSGKSVAQVATDHGVSTDSLIAGMTAEVDARIDAALAAGKIDATHATKLKAGITAAVTKLVNRVPHGKGSTQ